MKINIQRRFTHSLVFLAIGMAILFHQHSEALADVALEWQPVADSDIAGYNVFIRQEGEPYAYNSIYWSGTETSCVIDVPDEGQNYYFAVRAVSTKGVQSSFSNEVCYGCTLCPDDPDKVYAGACGCGVPDTDIDVDGIWDCYDPDDDNDGIEDIVEDSGPNQGDSNLDGILDSQQPNVGSITVDNTTIYIAIEAIEQIGIGDFQSVNMPAPEEVPPNIDFAFGLFEYDFHSVERDEIITVTITLPKGTAPDTYYAYGITSDNKTAHWHEFIYDGETGADINGNVITLYLADVLEGDDIQEQDNMIVGIGGPGFITKTDTGNNSKPFPELVSGETEIIESDSGCFLGCLTH